VLDKNVSVSFKKMKARIDEQVFKNYKRVQRHYAINYSSHSLSIFTINLAFTSTPRSLIR
jgi:hypothetical protein